MAAVKTIFLDIGGTLVRMGSPATAYRDILARRGYPAEIHQVQAWLSEARKEIGPPSRRNQDGFNVSGSQQDAWRDALVRSFLSRAGVGGNFERCRDEIWGSWLDEPVFQIFPDTVSVLTRLRELGFQMGVISNWEARLPELCQNLGIAHFFDFFVISETEGYLKPATELFRLGLERAGVSPSEAIHVGNDLVEDIQPALSLGMRAVLIQRDPGDGADHSPRLPSLEGLIPLVTADAWLQGRVMAGKGEAAGFTQLPWVRSQLSTHFGFEPFPGTLNIGLEGDQLGVWEGLRGLPGVPLEPEVGFCAARGYGVMLEGRVRAAAVVPEVPDYPGHIVEVVAPVSLREELCLGDGDSLTVAFPDGEG